MTVWGLYLGILVIGIFMGIMADLDARKSDAAKRYVGKLAKAESCVVEVRQLDLIQI